MVRDEIVQSFLNGRRHINSSRTLRVFVSRVTDPSWPSCRARYATRVGNQSSWPYVLNGIRTYLAVERISCRDVDGNFGGSTWFRHQREQTDANIRLKWRGVRRSSAVHVYLSNLTRRILVCTYVQPGNETTRGSGPVVPVGLNNANIISHAAYAVYINVMPYDRRRKIARGRPGIK